jgi:hypothetical protein
MADVLIAALVGGVIGVFVGVFLICLVSANGRD